MDPEIWRTVEWTDGEVAMIVVDLANDRIIDANAAAESFWCLPRAEILQASMKALLDPGEGGYVRMDPLDAVAFDDPGGSTADHFEVEWSCHSGPMPCAGHARATRIPGHDCHLVVLDIDAHLKPDPELRRLTWALEAYARSSKALIRSQSLTEMAERVCQAIVEHDDYALATIALLSRSPDQALQLIARAGDAVGYLDGLVLSIDESVAEGQGPTGRAMRSGKPWVMDDSLRDPVFSSWRDRAIRHGLRSSVTVPFRHEGGVVGAVLVYSARPRVFTAREVEIFQELGDELAFALSVLRNRHRLETERQARAEAEAEVRAQQAEMARIARALTIGEFASTIAHEITQPVAAVITNVETALRFLAPEVADIEKARAALQRALRDADRAHSVIRQTRKFVAREEQPMARHDINALADTVLGFLGSDLQSAQVEITFDRAPALPLITCSDIQLQQVIINLVINAKEALLDVTDRDRRIAIATAMDREGTVSLEVRDNGHGMSPEARSKVFEHFYTSKKGGIGLGLSISRSIAEAHGGRLECLPHSPCGTLFRLTLPADTPAATDHAG